MTYAARFPLSPDKYTLLVGKQTFATEYVDEWGPPAAGAVLAAPSAVAVFSLVQRHLASGSSAGAAKT